MGQTFSFKNYYMFYLNFNKLTITVYTKKKLIMILEITITFLDFEDTYTRNLRPEIARKNKNKLSSALENRQRMFITKVDNSNVAIKM